MFQVKSLFGWLCSLLSLCILAGVFAWVPALGQNSDATKARIKALLVEKRNVLRERVDAYESLLNSGRNSFDAALAARIDLLDAEIALASDKPERIELLERKLANAREGEALMNQRLRNATVPPTEALMATVRRLDAEVELLREKE